MKLPGHGRLRTALVGAAVLVPIAAAVTVLPAGAAANNGLTLVPASGATLSGSTAFNVAAPGCPAPANSAVPTISGTGVTGTNADGSTNIVAAQQVTPGSAIALDTTGLTWDGIASDPNPRVSGRHGGPEQG